MFKEIFPIFKKKEQIVEEIYDRDNLFRLIFKGHISKKNKVKYTAFMLREGKDKDGLSFNWQNKCVDKDACLLKSKEEYREKNNVCNIITGVLRNDCNSFVKHTPSKNDDSHVSVGPMDGVASILHDKHRCMIYAQLIAEKVELVD